MELIIPAISLISSVVPELLSLFGKKNEAVIASKVIDVAKKVTGTNTADEATAAIAQSPELAFKLKEALLSHKEELERIALQRETLYVGDVQDARKYRDEKLFILGCVIYGIFFLSLSLAMIGGYFVLKAPKDSIDPVILGSVAALIGSIIGYTASQAQSVTNFNFGTSYGSMTKGDDMADAVKSFGQIKKD